MIKDRGVCFETLYTTVIPLCNSSKKCLEKSLWIGETKKRVMTRTIEHQQDIINSLLHLMRTIACTHISTRATSLMHVKNSTCHFCL